jgi:signal transduction histidine kinase/FixJ family two-component response regulator/HPt (histidine-containing phosphotransfer) domain-containing protein
VIVRASEKPAEDRAASGQNDHTGQLLAQFSHAASGEFVAPSQTDGITRVFAYRGTSGLPLIVQVGIAQSETLRRFTKNARNLYFLGGVVTILALMVMTMHLVRDSQLRKARDAAEARYALKLRLLATTVANISQGIVVIGADNQVELCNQRLSDMLDLPAGIPSPPEPLARMLHWLWTHDEFENAGGDFDTWLTTSLAALRARGARRSFEHTRPNGVILDIRTSLLPDGGIVRSFTDITDRKLEMQLLHAAQAGAARATEAKSAFLAIMSHEIRSPLSGLLGVLDLLRATPLDPEQSRMAGMIHGCGKMLLAVLNDILDFSKIEAGRLSVTAEPVDLHALLNEAVQPHILPGSDKGIDVSLSIDPSVPRMVMTDGLRVAQILGNLLSNAMKFTAGGRVAVRADIMAEAAGAPRLRVRVRDTGIGMDAGTISRLFKPFTQADGSITRTFGGTGLGLCISQQLACLLGGAISVSSRPNEGSHFSLSLPCVACAPPEVAQETNDDTQACPDVGGGLRVLLVDDDPTNRWLGQSQLRRLGFATDIAEDGEAALASLRATRYDLLVTDLHMPRMSGVDLAQAVRGDPDLAWRDVPIIGLTADTTDEQRLRCQQAGMTELTIKPITAVKLAALISRVLHRPGAPDTPPQAAQEAENATGGLLLTPFDPRIYLEIFPTHDQDGAEWLRGYLQHAQQDVDQLGAILEDGLALTEPACTPLRTELARIAHRLAGASFSVGATLMGQTARALEHAAQRDPAQGLRALHRTLRGQLASATRAIDIFQSAEHVADVTGGVQA